MPTDDARMAPGDRVEYLPSGVSDRRIVRGDVGVVVGVVVGVDGGWVRARWLRSAEELAVPLADVCRFEG